MFRVLTLNLWGANGPAEQRVAALVAYLRAARPDVLALQEVESWADTTQAHHLAEALDYRVVHHVRTGRGPRRGEGLAVLTDLEADPGETVALPDALLDHPRALQQLDVVAPGGAVVRIANTHLAWRLEATAQRAAQAAAIREALAGWSGPVGLLGDLNDVAGSPPLEILAEAGLVDAYLAVHGDERPTFDRANPYVETPELGDRRIDHVLVRGLAVRDAAVVLDGTDGPLVSDHYGVRATLTG